MIKLIYLVSFKENNTLFTCDGSTGGKARRDVRDEIRSLLAALTE